MASVLWHLYNIPVIFIAAAVVICLWRAGYDMGKWPNLPARIRLPLAIVAFVVIQLYYGTFLGRDAGMAALILLSATKLLEINSERDFTILSFLTLFIVLGNFLYDQAISSFILMLLTVFFLVEAMLRLHLIPIKKRSSVFLTLKMIIQAMPIFIILFLFFPRVPGFFWNISRFGQRTGISGFSDSITLGQVANVSLSKVTVGRVYFPDNNMPAYHQLYFRGIVLWNTDGKSWFHGSFPSRQVRNSAPVSNTVRQEFFLEPHNLTWLFALDRPYRLPDWARQYPGQIFALTLPLKTSIHYEIDSIVSPENLEDISPLVRKWSLQHPRHISNSIINLAEKWQRQARNDQEIVNMALEYFAKGGFVYSLSPDKLDSNDPIDDFLFHKKAGFCEHFATSFTLLMRLCQIPSRVILGYHGGYYNQVGKFLLIRQMDAHAWSEVWLSDKGWVRIDPTAAVAPDRLNYGIDGNYAGLTPTDEESTDSGKKEDKAGKNIFSRIIRIFIDLWDTLRFNLSYWIISYNRFQQWNFLESLGMPGGSSMTLIIILFAGIFVILALFRLWLRRDILRPEPILSPYLFFCRKAARKGLSRHPWEGPLDFSQRLLKIWPEKEKEIEAIVHTFIKLHYGNEKKISEKINQWKKMIRRLRLPTRKIDSFKPN